MYSALITHIAEIHHEATTTGAGKLTGREFTFIGSIYAQSQRSTFTGLSAKQEAWFNAIAKRLMATKGKLAVEIIGEKHRHRLHRYRAAYETACFGY